MDTILAAHQPPPGSNRQNQSPWLFLDAANTIFETAKRRVYAGKAIEGVTADTGGRLPDSLSPILEEQPKWALLADILDEIERDAYLNPGIRDESNSTILIMCTDQGTCRQLREYLPQVKTEDDGDDEPKPSADFILRRKLRNYLKWRKDFAKVSASLFNENQKALDGYTSLSDQHAASKYRGKPPPNKRRRVRGGSAAAANGGRATNGSVQVMEDKESQVASLMAEIQTDNPAGDQQDDMIVDDLDEMEDYYELYDMDDLVVVHPYDGDLDEHVLEELKPRYVIMYEPDAAFIRRVEVYRSSHADRNVRVYFMYYSGSVEEQRYLSAVRKEKDAFTRLIKEKAVSCIICIVVTAVEISTEHGCDHNPRYLCRRSSRILPPHRQHSNSRRRPSRRNSRTTPCGRRRPRVPVFPPLPPPRSFQRRCPLHAHGRRLRADTSHLHRAQIRQRSNLILQNRPLVQPSRDHAPALQVPNATNRIRPE